MIEFSRKKHIEVPHAGLVLWLIAETVYVLALFILSGAILWATIMVGISNELGLHALIAFFFIEILLIFSAKYSPAILVAFLLLLPFVISNNINIRTPNDLRELIIRGKLKFPNLHFNLNEIVIKPYKLSSSLYSCGYLCSPLYAIHNKLLILIEAGFKNGRIYIPIFIIFVSILGLFGYQYSQQLQGITLIPDPIGPQPESSNIMFAVHINDSLNISGNKILLASRSSPSSVDRLCYQYSKKGPATNNTWETATNWINNSTWVWTTSSDDVGENFIQVRVVDRLSKNLIPIIPNKFVKQSTIKYTISAKNSLT